VLQEEVKGGGEDNIGIIISWLFKFNMIAAMTMFECRETLMFNVINNG